MPVAEGPFIKPVPGGYAEWRAKETGLPPARLVKPEGEWWGQLVPGAGDIGGDIGGGDVDTTVDVVDPNGPIISSAPDFDPDTLTKPSDPNWDYYTDPKVDPYEWKTDYTPIDWDVNYNEVPKGYGWGVPTDSPLPYSQGGIVGGTGPSSRGAVVPGGQGDRLTTRGSAGLEKPLVEFEPSPTEYAKGYDPSKTFVEKPGAIEDLKAVATDGLKLGEKWIDAIAGKTAADFKPRDPKEAAAFNKFKKGYEIFVAAIKEGGGVFGGTLYETGGGRTTLPSETGEVPQAHFPNILKTLRKVFAGEKDPIVMQDYGDLHWATIIATIGLANTYGPIVWAIPGLRTMADTIGASMNGMLMDKPNLEGNPIQDTMHRLFWIAGQAGQKVYENSIGKIIEKLRGTPKSEKTRGTISEELDDLINIKDAFKGHEIKRIKVSGDIEAAGAKHLQPHDPITDTIGTKPGTQITAQVTGQQPAQLIGTTAQPVRVPTQRPTQRPSEPTDITQLDPKSITDPEQLPTKTITGPLGEFPQGAVIPREPLPEFEEPRGLIDEARIEALADEIMGERPTGEKPFIIEGLPPAKEKPVEAVQEMEELEATKVGDVETPEAAPSLPMPQPDEGKGEWARFDNVPIDASGKVWGDLGFDPNNIVDYRDEAVRIPEGMSDAEIQADFERIKAEQPKDEPKGEPDPTVPPTEPQDFRSDYQKELGLTVGNQWVDESDRSTWPAIAATQRSQWNERTQQFDLMYNRNLPQSNIPDHPQYYENNPEHVSNITPDVNIDWTPAGGKDEEIFNWSDQAGLNPTIFKPIYNNDYQLIGNEMFTLETESYPKGDGWGYRYRYNSAETDEKGEWNEWVPGG